VRCQKEMSGAAPQYEERGGLLQRAHAHAAAAAASTDTMNANANALSGEAQSNPSTSSSTSITEHDFRFPRRPAEQKPGEVFSAISQLHSGASTSANTTTGGGSSSTSNSYAFASTEAAGASDVVKLDFSTANSARKELLRESFFPTWKDDAAGEELDSPDEMQKKDPLATQIWRLYSKTKKQLPNQERMENLTWRMMAMSLRKRRQEEAARYVWRDVIE
jgi:GATA-binding protein